jgi:acetate kinase
MEAVATHLNEPAQVLRIVSCHLGNGASVAAIEQGRSVDTSMGMTPLEGLVMGTRSGDVDPGALLHLLRSGEYDAERLDGLLNHESGMKGLTGTNDLREIERRAADGDESCENAIAIYAHRVRKYIGAYAAAMGGLDAIAFTGGIGEHSPFMRSRILQRLEFLGVRLDDGRNRQAKVTHEQPITTISTVHSAVAVAVVQADEEAAMVKAAAAVVSPPAGH